MRQSQIKLIAKAMREHYPLEGLYLSDANSDDFVRLAIGTRYIIRGVSVDLLYRTLHEKQWHRFNAVHCHDPYLLYVKHKYHWSCPSITDILAANWYRDTFPAGFNKSIIVNAITGEGVDMEWWEHQITA